MAHHDELIRRFYEAFQHRDHAVMAACYGPDPRFSDPVFTDLRGAQVAAMWRMLCERGKDLEIEASAIVSNAASGSARWEAHYTFSGTGRHVHNVITASFAFEDGRIARHTDRFDLYRWARQALGIKGVLLGWSPPVQNAIRRQASRSLAAFRQNGGPPAAGG
jgi:limonene-1,2-epoxide hydrolase